MKCRHSIGSHDGQEPTRKQLCGGCTQVCWPSASNVGSFTPSSDHATIQTCGKDSLSNIHACHPFASHQALQNLSPGSLAFHQDVFFDFPLLTDIAALQNTHQQLVDQ